MTGAKGLYLGRCFTFKFSKSFPSILIIKPIGVTTKKNITPIINGDTILPKKIPNLNHSLFNGVKILELNKPSKRKITPISKDHTRIPPEFSKGQSPIMKKTIKNTIPKLLFDPILIS